MQMGSGGPRLGAAPPPGFGRAATGPGRDGSLEKRDRNGRMERERERRRKTQKQEGEKRRIFF